MYAHMNVNVNACAPSTLFQVNGSVSPICTANCYKSYQKGNGQKEKVNKFVGFNDSNEMIVQFGTILNELLL